MRSRGAEDALVYDGAASERRAALRYALAGTFELLEGLAELLHNAKR